MQLNSKPNYKKALAAGKIMRQSLLGDNAYSKPSINAIALQERITGWIMAQKWYAAYCVYCRQFHKRENTAAMASDMALEVTSDLLHNTADKGSFDDKGILRFNMQ